MTSTYDIAVIGAGSGGLTVAATAAAFGRRVVLFERGRMGGDCLNYGCVPSKALLAAAKHAHAMRSGAAYGIAGQEPQVDFAAVMAHVKRAIAAIAPHDSQERFEGLGVTVVRATARFRDRGSIVADGQVYAARRMVIATGSRPGIPPIAGLADVPFLTNETLFENTARPDHLVIIGAGPIGLEMAQAHRRLGSAVTVLEAGRPLSKDDPELAAVVVAALEAEGVSIRSEVKIERIERTAGGIAVALAGGERIPATHLLVAAGRKPNIEDLDLEAAGVASTAKGVTVDRQLKTSNRRIYAIGDVAGGPQFTHAAGYHGGLVIRNALFGLPASAQASVPWVTYTDPELAQTGLSEAEARARHGGALSVLRWPFHNNDRAQAEGHPEGLVKVIVGRRGRILGASIVGPQAGELIQPWVLAQARGIGIAAMAQTVLPYPTRGEAGKRAAVTYFANFATNRWARRVIGIVQTLIP